MCNIFRDVKIKSPLKSFPPFLPFSFFHSLPLSLRNRSGCCDESADAQDLIPKVIPNKQTYMKLAPDLLNFAHLSRCICAVLGPSSVTDAFSRLIFLQCPTTYCRKYSKIPQTISRGMYLSINNLRVIND